MKENKLAKALPICTKNSATANEIIAQCGAVCKIYLETGKDKLEQGLLSCSYGHEGGCLAICLWKAKDADSYEKVEHFKMYLGDLITLRGHIEVAEWMPPLSEREQGN